MDTLKKLEVLRTAELLLGSSEPTKLIYAQLLARIDLELAHLAELQKKPSPQPK